MILVYLKLKKVLKQIKWNLYQSSLEMDIIVN